MGMITLFKKGAGGGASMSSTFDGITVTSVAAINHLDVSSNATFTGTIQVSVASFSGLITASNINANVGSFTSLFVNGSAVLTSSVGATSFDGITVSSIGNINHLVVSSQASFTGTIQASAASFNGAVTMSGSLNVTGGIQSSNASVNNLIVAGSHSVAGNSQFSNASFSGTITTTAINADFGSFSSIFVSSHVIFAGGFESSDATFTAGVTVVGSFHAGVASFVGCVTFSTTIGLSAIPASIPNFNITATSCIPVTTFNTLTGFNNLPDGRMLIYKNGSAVFIPFWR